MRLVFFFKGFLLLVYIWIEGLSWDVGRPAGSTVNGNKRPTAYLGLVQGHVPARHLVT